MTTNTPNFSPERDRTMSVSIHHLAEMGSITGTRQDFFEGDDDMAEYDAWEVELTTMKGARITVTEFVHDVETSVRSDKDHDGVSINVVRGDRPADDPTVTIKDDFGTHGYACVTIGEVKMFTSPRQMRQIGEAIIAASSATLSRKD